MVEETKGCPPPFDGDAHDKTIINLIMLRFRPIAPRPATDGSFPVESPTVHKNKLVPKGRAKRKYVRVNKNRKCKKNKAKEIMACFSGTVMTPPEIASGPSKKVEFPVVSSVKHMPVLMKSSKSDNENFLDFGSSDLLDRTAVMKFRRVVESWVIVEGVTDRCMESEALGNTDMERMNNLRMDTCPGFISDGFDKVQWVNLAYMKMVDPKFDGESTAEMVARLVVKDDKLLSSLQYQRAFACKVRVVYSSQKENLSQIMPCDVWRMDFGGFAWRLDVKAALSLGR